MIPIYPIEAAVLQHITDWFAIFISTFFIGLVIVDYFAWCPIKKVDIKIANQSVMCCRTVASVGSMVIIAKIASFGGQGLV